METIKLKKHTDDSGTLRLELPTELRNHEFEVLVVFQAVKDTPQNDPGWPEGYFEQTYGSFANDPLERAPQGSFEVRERLE